MQHTGERLFTNRLPTDVISTLGMSCCRKPERSSGCRQSAPCLCWAEPQWRTELHSICQWREHSLLFEVAALKVEQVRSA